MSKRNSSGPSRQKLIDFYNGKSVAVAGGAGFVGVQLVRLLSDVVGEYGEVLVLDNFSRGTNIVKRQNVMYGVAQPHGMYLPCDWKPSEEIHSVIGNPGVDLWRGYEHYAYMLGGVDIFFNLAAAVAGVLHNQSSHLQMYDDNVRLLAGPLRACEQAGVGTFFQTSSVCVYAEDHQSPSDESRGWGGDPHPANAGYAEAKRDGERMAKWSKIPRVVIGRPSNIIGPYDYFDGRAHVVPAFIHRAITTEGDFQAYGNGAVVREFIYSWDVAVGMAYIAAFGEDREAYNIGTNGEDKVSMYELAKSVINTVGALGGKGTSRKIVFDDSIGGGDNLRYSNAEKLFSLGWRPTVSTYQGIAWSIEEYMYRGGWRDPEYWDILELRKTMKNHLDAWLGIPDLVQEGRIDADTSKPFPGLDSIIEPPPYEEPKDDA